MGYDLTILTIYIILFFSVVLLGFHVGFLGEWSWCSARATVFTGIPFPLYGTPCQSFFPSLLSKKASLQR
ncbi:hypothetical protein V8F06_008230 [Rhypophila decipiens]